MGSLGRRRLEAGRLLRLSRRARPLAALALAAAALALAAGPAAARAPLAVGVIDSGVGAADATGHGSAVAATLRDALGTGVSARIASYPDLNRAGFAQPRLMAAAIRRAAADGVRVVNISQTIRGAAPRVRRAIAAAPETLFVVAAGNEGLDLDRLRLERDPCTAPSPNVICVAAIGRDGELARASNRGRDSVDVAAPGPATSLAAPRVAARAATLLWHHPGWGGEELREATVAQLLTSYPSWAS